MSNSLIELAGMMVVMSVPISAIVARHRTNMVKMQLQADNGAGRQTNERIAALEDRIRVLERIVTDRGFGLANEIEALRRTDAEIPPVEARSKAFQ